MGHKIYFAIQASSTSWSGSRDYTVKKVNNQPAIYWTIKKIFDDVKEPSVTITAPKFDQKGEFNLLPSQFDNKIKIYYGFDDSPLDRLLAAFEKLGDDDYLIRIDGLNFAFDIKSALAMLRHAQQNRLDCLKFPDDFPIQFTFDVYRVGALRKVKKMLGIDDNIYKIHPKYFMFLNPSEFNVEYSDKLPHYSNEDLASFRKQYKTVYEARQGGLKHRIEAGDQLTYHYELAAQYVKKNMKVLDIACGEGYGTKILSKKAASAIGADIDQDSITIAIKLHKANSNLEFSVENATKTSFSDKSFDLITSMETIEHIKDDKAYLVEMNRILANGGYFILTTPQNSLGQIPMNNQHFREYSLKQLTELVGKIFNIEKIIGIKQGRISFANDPIGNNTILICRKNN